MADVMRWIEGDTNPVVTPAVLSGIEIEIGDLIYRALVSGQVYPASALPDQGTESANQILFACQFLGVAEQRSRDGDTDAIRVATSGVFQFCVDALAAAVILGTRFGASENAAGTALRDQFVEEVDEGIETIAHLARIAAAGDTCVHVDIKSTVMGRNVNVQPEWCEQSSSSGPI